MAGRARVFSPTLWLMARACAYLRAALAVARATAAEHAWTTYATCVGCGHLRRSTRMHMLQNIRNTIRKDTGDANMTIWIEDSLTMRHIRLALEDNCTSCTRHPNLTIDGGAHSLTPALETDFTTCCL